MRIKNNEKIAWITDEIITNCSYDSYDVALTVVGTGLVTIDEIKANQLEWSLVKLNVTTDGTSGTVERKQFRISR